MYYNHCLAVLLIAAVLMVSSCAGDGERKPERPVAGAESSADRKAALLDPSLANEQAPDQFKAKFSTTKGDFVIEVTREWAPQGTDRFYNLVKIGYFDDAAFFRNIENFMVQFGINGNPAVNKKWNRSNIKDDPVKQSNQRGYVTFAQKPSLNSRSTQIFINFGDNGQLDEQRFAPFGHIVEGMDVVESLYSGYGEGPPRGRGPDQGRIQEEGNVYLKKDFPKLDYINSAQIVN
jgi:peptidyl-prolyl cis-trans isomerase A (cyclophilin A)